jgi:alkylation response protein AidB-like acyl-CoA dehydrogenase
LMSAKEVGGMGKGLRAAAEMVEQVGRACGSTGMVLCMHFTGNSAIEKYGPRAVREAIAAGRHLTTVALSEAGSRSHFWVPLSTASDDGDGHVRLDANKSWATSAGQADSYVWSSKPLAAEGLSSLWIMPGKAEGLSYPALYNGLGLRGNASSPIKAHGARIPRDAMLGEDGKGYDIMMNDLNPCFLTLSSACYLGIMDAAATKAAAHVASTQLSHLGQSLAELPTIRAYVARMRIKTDMVRALLSDTLTAMETGRHDTMLRIMEVKAAAGEAATEVTDLAMRVCGGVAFRKEVGIERHFRDARAAAVMAPTTDVLYDLIGKLECGMPT